jgi:hypothetical protein
MLEGWENLGKAFWGLMLIGLIVVGVSAFLSLKGFFTYEQERRKWVRSISDNKRYKV